jgi:ABC-type antimicrobial peptide transport system permease subunit
LNRRLIRHPADVRVLMSALANTPDWPLTRNTKYLRHADAQRTSLRIATRAEFLSGTKGVIPVDAKAIFPKRFADSRAAARLRREITAVDSDVAVSETGPMDDFLKRSYYAGPRFTLIIFGAFGVTALLLVLIGIFSTLAYTVSLQTHEIGIRMALEAQQKDVLLTVLKKGLTLVLVGTIVGLAASSAMMRLLAGQIWGVSTADPWTFSVVATMVVAVGLTASLFPARRAAQVDPTVSLRCE